MMGRNIVIALATLVGLGFVSLQYLTNVGMYLAPIRLYQLKGSSLDLTSLFSIHGYRNITQEVTQGSDVIASVYNFPEAVVDNRHFFSYADGDVMVHLHIPKTGGSTFGKHLMSVGRCRKMNKTQECDVKKMKRGWLFSRYHYVTMLRNPRDRLVSESKHTAHAGAWPRNELRCNFPDKTPLKNHKQLPTCRIKGKWLPYVNLSTEYFLNCENNYGVNRQIVMLANLSDAGCPPHGPPALYRGNHSSTFHTRWEQLLDSAKLNLQKLAYFGLTEYQTLSRELFEWTFKLKFGTQFEQRNKTVASRASFVHSVEDKIDMLTFYENKLYDFGRELFFRRIKKMQSSRT